MRGTRHVHQLIASLGRPVSIDHVFASNSLTHPVATPSVASPLPSAPQQEGASALHFACSPDSYSPDIARMLLNAGADPEVADSSYGNFSCHFTNLLLHPPSHSPSHTHHHTPIITVVTAVKRLSSHTRTHSLSSCRRDSTPLGRQRGRQWTVPQLAQQWV